ncbi:MAG: DUF151 domain-containing protein [Chloroflexota bacterium]|nr:DUF151 domain-containing protein [Chloroflexota bacterium]
MEDRTDAALVAAARAGDKEALGVLLLRHRPLLLALCRRTLGDVEAAEDAAQEASLQALLHLDRLRDGDRFGPWLAGIGLNVCRRILRWRRSDPWSWEAVVGGRSGREPVDREPGPEERAEAAEVAARVRRTVAGLPRGQWAAVALVYLAGLTQAEAAAELGVAPGAVKARLFKARATLRRELPAAWEDGTMATTAATGVVEVRVADVRRGPAADGHETHTAVVLEEVGGGRRLPIWTGDFEGTAIALRLEGTEPPRPTTYAFTAGLLAAAGGRLREVRIERLADDVYYAVTVLDGPSGEARIDARPSDAINLALLQDAPIRVARDVFERMATASGEPEADVDAQGKDAAPAAGEGRVEIAAKAVAEWTRWAPSASPQGQSSST